jgi:hypothetical protein
MIENPFMALAISAVKINKNFLWAALILALLFYVIISGVLLFHWQRYGMGSRKIKFARNLYFLVSVAILFGAVTILTSI